MKKFEVNKVFKISATDRWEIISRDKNNWQVGIYKPEYKSPDEIDKFEKHSGPELFICVNGRCGLLLRNGNAEKKLILEPFDAILVTDFHNGFLVDDNGFFIVVEYTNLETQFIDRH